jgi:glutamyl/glutaminyl-tRNA synthetase
LITQLENLIPKTHHFHQQNAEWKNNCVELLKQKVDFLSEMQPMMDQLIFGESIEMDDELKDVLTWETTPKIVQYIGGELSKVSADYVSEAQLNLWSDFVKKDLGIKGKPLFMGLRAALTGRGHGPDLKFLIPLTPISVIKKRISQLG